MSFRHIPIRCEGDYWPRSYMYPSTQVWSGNYDPFPLDRKPWHFEESRPPIQRANNDGRYMMEEMNRMMRDFGRNAMPSVDDWRLTDTFRGNRNVVPAIEDRRVADSFHTNRSAITAPSVDDYRMTENFRMDNPIKEDYNGSRKFYLQFDVRQFKPEEIHVRTNGNQLTVHARHEEKDSGKSSFREYNRQYILPREVSPECLVSKLNHDGLLAIEAPLPALAGPSEKILQIEHKK